MFHIYDGNFKIGGLNDTNQDYKGKMDDLFPFIVYSKNNIKQMLNNYSEKSCEIWTPHPADYCLSLSVSTDFKFDKDYVKEIFYWDGTCPMIIDGILKDIVETVEPLIDSL